VWPEGEWIVLSREWVAETGHARAVMTFKPLIVYRDQNASVGPWHPTQDDILAWDWKII
jgi:hypothetical protein